MVWRVTKLERGNNKPCLKHTQEIRPGGYRRKVVIPSSLLNFESLDTKAKLGHTAHDVFKQIQVLMISRELSPISKVSGYEIDYKLIQIQMGWMTVYSVRNHEQDVNHA
eukprot:1154127-Pelagomonas_calceolata.AAC.2